MPPFIARRIFIPLHEAILRRPTLALLRNMEASQWWPVERLREWQGTRLRELLRHAAARCDFYRARLRQARIDPERAGLADLARLPALSKDDIAAHMAGLVVPSIPGGLRRATTGGSSGQPLAFMIDRRRQAADQAARARSRRWFGIEPGEREAYLWGSPIETSRQDRLRGLRDRLTNHLLLSAFDMTPRRMNAHLDAIRAFAPAHLFGYPSSLATLFRHARRLGRRAQTASLRAVFTAGETLMAADRAIIEESVAVPVADGYGSREAGFIAHQCPEGAYHVTMESVILEVLRDEGAPAPAEEVGEIAITHLDAWGMPFIRYRTGDLGALSDEPCRCGRGLQVLRNIQGRRTDMLRTAGGGFTHALSIIYALREEPAIAQFKVRQDRNLDLEVAIVERMPMHDVRREELCRTLQRQIGGTARARIMTVDAIPPEPSGKHRCVVSHAE